MLNILYSLEVCIIIIIICQIGSNYYLASARDPRFLPGPTTTSTATSSAIPIVISHTTTTITSTANVWSSNVLLVCFIVTVLSF